MAKVAPHHDKLLKKSVQSICTHYSSLSGRPDIFYGLQLKKNQFQNMERVQKSMVNVIQKKEAAWPFLFLNNQGVHSIALLLYLSFCCTLTFFVVLITLEENRR